MNARRHPLACVLAALWLVLGPSVAPAQTSELPAEQRLPEALGPTRLVERRQLQPESVGIVFQYAAGRRLWATVYVYDFGIRDVSSTLSDLTVLRVYLHAEEEIAAMVRSGRLRAARIPDGPPRLVEPSPCGRAHLRKDLELDVPGGTHASTIVFTTVRGKFVKVRLSHVLGDTASQADAQAFFDDLARALGGCA